jgi:orotidine-5'-phosphate decarboxylase
MQPKNIPLNERIIFALDVDSPDKAKDLVKKLESHIGFYKVGLQLFLAGWFPIVDWITDRGHKVMVDLKFYDVPETVKLAVGQLNNRGITFATVHGNAPITRAAAEARKEVKILAVTVLTSFGEEDMKDLTGAPCKVEDLVLARARSALSAGIDGIVSSGLEARLLREKLGDNFLIVTPGIRPARNSDTPVDDQKRIMTAGQAISNGADHIVVGRPIKNASDPIAVVESMRKEIEKALVT